MNYLFSNKDLKNLILPLVLEQALAITVGMADTMMVSSVGEVAVSGVSLVDMLNYLIFSIFAALATGGAVVVSQNIGAGKLKDARGAAKQLLYTVIFFSTLITVLVLCFRRGLLSLLFGRIDEDVMEAALLYLSISALSFPFLGIYNSCAALFRSMGMTNITFNVSVIGNLINVVGNAIGIFVLHLGVAGVALPTLISRIVMAGIVYVMLRNPERTICFERDGFRLDFRTIRNILYIGIPSSVENGIFQLGRVMVVSIISAFGTVQIAANGVANSIDSVGCIMGQAMNLAMITVIGTCVGAGDPEQVKHYLKKLLLITYAGTACIIIPCLLFLNPILSLFSLGEETQKLAYILIFIHNGIALFLWPLAFTFPNMLRASNDVKFPMAVSIFSMWSFRIGFSYILGIRFGLGAIGVWIAMIIDWIFRILCFTLRYLHGDWKKTMYRLV
ncbi:MAG: MATE family efflux transporter [Eubacteriales bacterium]|nr:MATE family efflux transporter [Eubacteriales bacterium]